MTNLATVGNSQGLAIRDMDDLNRMSKMLASSGYFKDATDAAKAGVKILAGQAMGIGPFEAMTGIHIIEGKPSVGANLMAAAIKRHPRYDYKVKKLTKDECVVAFFENGSEVGTTELTMEEAKSSGIAMGRSGLKTNWEKFSKNMMFARCISNGVKFYCPDVFSAPTYTPEELGAEVDGEGNYIEGEVIENAVTPAEPLPEPELTAKQIIDNARAQTKHTAAQIKALAFPAGLPSSSAEMTVEQAKALSVLMHEDVVVDAEVP